MLSALKKIGHLSPFYLILLVINTACVTFRESDRKVYRQFKKTPKTPHIYTTDYKDKTLRYIADKPIDNKLPTILFIHGAPGGAGNFFRYLKDEDLGKKANLISVDRLGYGYSDFGNAETAIEIQAESIYTIAEEHALDNLIVVGWSYGVPIAAKMAYKYAKVKHSVLIAGAISPEDEKFFAIAKMAEWKLTKWMVPKALRVADIEKNTHVAELTKMLPDWQQLTAPITYYHGDQDRIVPYSNMGFITERVPDTLLNAVTIKDGNHFILFNNYEMVKRDLLGILEEYKQ